MKEKMRCLEKHNSSDKFVFSTEIPVRIGDINRRNHLSNTAFLVITEESRKQFLSSLGFADDRILGFIITDISIIYMKQAFYGQVLRIDIGAGGMTEKAFNLVYRISDSKTGTELARADSGIVFYDYSKGKVIPVPDDIRSKLSEWL
jgi:acyl-CoA thioesterase FadM